MADSVAITLDNLLEPLSRCLDEESSRRIAEFRISEDIEHRIAILASRANEGKLTDDQRREYEAVVDATDFIAILQRKALRHLSPPSR